MYIQHTNHQIAFELDCTSGAEFIREARAHFNDEFVGLRFEKLWLGTADFSGCRFENCEFVATDLTRANFSRANLHEVTMKDVNASQAIIRAAWLEEISIGKSSFDLSDWSASHVCRCDFNEVRLHNADFTGAALNNCDFVITRAADIEFTGAWIRNVRFFDCKLSAACFDKAAPCDVTFYWSSLNGASFSGTDMARVDCGSGELVHANLSDALLGSEPLLKYVCIGPIGSRNDMLHVMLARNSAIYRTGCFSGTEEEFRAQLEIAHPEGPHRVVYESALRLINDIKGEI